MAVLIKLHEDGTEEVKDMGTRVEAIQYDNDGIFDCVAGNKPMIGCSLLVGSVTARTYQHQDYWLTTTITEILEENEKQVVFKTKNSKYKLKW